MIALSWNCRGLGNPQTVRDLCRLVKEKRPGLVFLLETKLQAKRIEYIRVRTGFESAFVVDSIGRSGGLALMWKGDINVEIQNYSRRHINAIVRTFDNGPLWKFTGFYGHPVASKRRESWCLLEFLMSFQPDPWLCMGDFNEIIQESEKFGAKRKSRKQMADFRAALESCQLEDLGYVGSHFTWWNMQEGDNFIKERLDRALANYKWMDLFPFRTVEVLAPRSSDHAPVLISFKQQESFSRQRRCPFRYEAAWKKSEDQKVIIRKVWRVKKRQGDGWRSITEKLDESKKAILTWKRANRKDTDISICNLTRKLQELQEVKGVPNIGEVRAIQKNIQDCMEVEDLKWRQRAKETWLAQGDKNSKYFHACASQRRRANKIVAITDEEGSLHSTAEAIDEAFLRYFQGVLTTSNPSGLEECTEVIPGVVTDTMNQELLQDVSMEEVCNALSQMAPLKAPGPDGFPAGFYQDNWAEVGREVHSVIVDFFKSAQLNSIVNKTFIALVPKKNNSCKVSDFRPISLCNVLYKILSKVMANRLKVILPNIISPNQSAFIPERLISDNVLAAYETLHTMHSRMYGRVGYMAVKLDMSKAYDRVEWVFLEKVMSRMGFDGRWIALIMECVSSVSYSILINGAPVGNFKPSRGIRQGDPLSPYLFILCAQVLSVHLHRAMDLGLLRGVPTSPKGMRINHLFFADDSLLFCKATIHEWRVLNEVLDLYGKASGQRLNKDKTSVFFSRNTTQEVKDLILSVVGIPASQRYDTYLGLPALVGRSRIGEFENLKERVRRRVTNWKTKLLSQAGKEILLKAVVQAIPTYSMSIFLLPKELCKEINKLMQKFWWGSKGDEKKIHWMSWERMGRSKSKGGMGFRDLISFNKALLAKQCWRLIQYPDSLAALIIKEKYFSRGDFLSAKLGSRPSFAWRSLLAGRELLLAGLLWRIGDGKSVSIWSDKWIPRPTMFSVFSPCTVLPESAMVADLISGEPPEWNKGLIRSIFLDDEADLICDLPLSRYHQPDRLIWQATSSGEFTVRSAYHFEVERLDQKKGECSNSRQFMNLWKILWGLQVPNSTKVFLWRACNDILPTKEKLKKRGVIEDDLCCFCGVAQETIAHIIWECPSSQDVWGKCGRRIQKRNNEAVDFRRMVEDMSEELSKDELGLFAVTAKGIWKRRNSCIHGGVFVHPNSIVITAQDLCFQFQKANVRPENQKADAAEEEGRKWSNPPNGIFKVNWDAALLKDHSGIGIGAIIRDEFGSVIAALSRTVNARMDPVTAEATAALHAVELCRDVGVQDLILEGDSLTVVKAIASRGQINHYFGQIIEDIRMVLRSRRSWSVRHAKREANEAAHGLAKEATRCLSDKIWLEDTPSCISHIVNLELSALLL
jgi:ribonuclease HI/exonuclease III